MDSPGLSRGPCIRSSLGGKEPILACGALTAYPLEEGGRPFANTHPALSNDKTLFHRTTIP